MNNLPNMLDFVKAMSDADRLRIIGVLVQRSASVKQIASELDMPFRDAFNHLSYLEFVGAVRRTEDLYTLYSKAFESLSRGQFSDEREIYIPAPNLDENSRRVLQACLNPDGSIKRLPSSIGKPAQFRILLEYLIQAFTPGRTYSEKEVNGIIRRFNEDTAGLRRDLVDAGLLDRARDGSRYWRVKHGK